MRRGKIGKLQTQILACFLCMAIFAAAVLVGAALLFSRQNEDSFLRRMEDGMAAVGERVSANTQSLIELGAMIGENTLVAENFRPYDQLTGQQLYYYNSIISLLYQSRLQFDSLVDSIFLYADDLRVLYSMKERGMTSLDIFFGSFMRLTRYDASWWRSRLAEGTAVPFAVLPADTYTTGFVRDTHTVIPLVFAQSNHGEPNLLVIHLDVAKLAAMYADGQLFAVDHLVIYDDEGRLLFGPADAPEMHALTGASRLRLAGEDCYVAADRQSGLGVTVWGFTPVRTFLSMTAYFRFTVMAVCVVFILCGVAMALLMSRRAYAPIRTIGQDIRTTQAVPLTHDEYLSNELEAIRVGITQLASEREQFRARNRQHSQHYLAQGLTALLDGRALQDARYFAALLENEYGFRGRRYVCAALVLDAQGRDDYPNQSERMAQLLSCASRLFSEVAAMAPLPYQDNMLVLLLDATQAAEGELRQCLAQVAASLQDDDCALRMGLGGPADTVAEIPVSFEQALTELFAIPADEALALREEDRFIYDRAEIIAAANTRDLKRIADAAEEILTQAKAHGIPYHEAADIAQDIFETVMGVQRRLGPAAVAAGREEFSMLAVLILSPEINLAPMLAVLLRHIPYQGDSPSVKEAQRIALRTKAWLDAHYHETVSLDILADHIGVSPKYLSRIFKQEMGVNLSDYLAYVRVEQIKVLLRTGRSLEAIAESVGITNRTTFIRTFKKLEGITPSEWRSLHRGP